MVFDLTYPHQYHSSLPKCVMRIDDSWYDCTSWRNSHPGGAQMCDEFHGKDATDAFYSLHSKEAIQKLKRMKAFPLKEGDGSRDQVSVNYAKLVKSLEDKGWFEREWRIDIFRNILPVIALCVIGTYISYSYPIIATILLGLGMQQAGWLAHDYTHARGKLNRVLAIISGAFVNGLSVDWWSHKHNTHHTFVNRKGMDSDIHNEPVLFLWIPDVSDDTAYRRYQYAFYLFAYALLYVSWRLQSLRFVMGSGNKVEIAVMAMNYLWLALLPWKVALGSVIFGGFCVAIVVTANHQTEEMIEHDEPYNFVIDQYRSTRGVQCSDMFFEWFFGGMQYQLEHHLLPMLPRYRHPMVRPMLRKFSEENGLPFHVGGVWEIMKLNFDVMYRNSVTPAVGAEEAKKQD